MLIIFLSVLGASMFTSWLIGRKVFSIMEKKQSKSANTASLFTAMISLILIFVGAFVALSYGGLFRR